MPEDSLALGIHLVPKVTSSLDSTVRRSCCKLSADLQLEILSQTVVLFEGSKCWRASPSS